MMKNQHLIALVMAFPQSVFEAKLVGCSKMACCQTEYDNVSKFKYCFICDLKIKKYNFK